VRSESEVRKSLTGSSYRQVLADSAFFRGEDNSLEDLVEKDLWRRTRGATPTKTMGVDQKRKDDGSELLTAWKEVNPALRVQMTKSG
jgi:hypothetical protein